MKCLPIIFAAPLFAACHAQQPVAPIAAALNSPGHAFATSTCGSCHAVEPGSITSPNPNAPPFPAIVNKEGLTKETLSLWLRDAHNYPDEMQFQLDPDKADDLVTYMLTLRDPSYRPAS